MNLRLLLVVAASSSSAGLRLPGGVSSRREWMLSSSAAVAASAAALLPSQQRAVASDTPPITFKAYAKGNKAFEAIAELDAQYPKEERNVQPGGEPSEHVPKIRFDAGKVVFEVPMESLAKPNHADGYTEFMWIKDAKTNAIIASKKFRASDPSPPTLVASVPPGTRLTACSKCSLHGVWQGSFTSP